MLVDLVTRPQAQPEDRHFELLDQDEIDNTMLD